MIPTDRQLLDEYARHRSQEAFSTLVARYINLVYSAALRQLRNTHAAEDVTQRTFIMLATKAGQLGDETILAGWLMNVARYLCLDFSRTEARRRKHEQRAAQMAPIEYSDETQSDWSQLSGELDEALEQVGPTNRIAVILRYLQGLSVREVAQLLEISEDAAKQRMSRGVEQLRDFFSARGVTIPAAAIASALSAHAVKAAPSALMNTTVAASASLLASTGLKGALLTMAAANLKNTAVAAILILFLGFSGGALIYSMSGDSNAPQRPQTSITLAPTQPDSAPPAKPSLAGQPIDGVVKRADGTPVLGAEISMGGESRPISIYNSWSARTELALSTSDGKFSLIHPDIDPDSVCLVIRSDDGFAEITPHELSQRPQRDVVLQPWARVEGVLKIGQAVGANTGVALSDWGSSNNKPSWAISHLTTTTTDAQGRFVFPKVAPGDVWITHRVTVLPGKETENNHTYADARAGSTTFVQVGGTGRPVTGRVTTAAAPNRQIPLFTGSLWASANINLHEPKNKASMTAHELRAYEHAWRASPEGQEWKRQIKNYNFPVNPDGTFTVPDVTPGRYQLQLRSEIKDLASGKASTVAKLDRDITVPPPNPQNPEEPLNLGALTAKLRTR